MRGGSILKTIYRGVELSNILTPVSLWKDFDDSLDVNAEVLSERSEDGIKFQYIHFFGRQTEKDRVKIYAAFAQSEKTPSDDAVILLSDFDGALDEELIRFFVKAGYSVLMPDYRGRWEGCEKSTVYPEDIAYANVAECAGHRDVVNEDASRTCWYEWVAVARYAYKYLTGRGDINKVGAVGIRAGGEIVWKLAATVDLACIVTVCAAGWKTYSGYHKFSSAEPKLDEERYRFIAGIDSQSYAPFVRCPVLMLCSTNDDGFDYDRAYDTYSRINEKYIGGSVISYSVHCNGLIDTDGTNDMLLFLDGYVKERQVFIPKPAEIVVMVDNDENLVARAEFDEHGVPEVFGMYMSEDCLDPLCREWSLARYKGGSDNIRDFYLDIYEKTSVLFAFCYAKYTNGFTVWSKMTVKRVSGKFRNMRKKCNVIYSAKNGVDSFSIADRSFALGGVFLTSDTVLPQVVDKGDGLKGLYSVCGLMTFRLNSPRYAPAQDSVLKLDVMCDNDAVVSFGIKDIDDGACYNTDFACKGGVWHTVLLECKQFKDSLGKHLPSFCRKIKFSIVCSEQYAVNNIMWL